MASVETEAVVLRVLDLGESDRLVRLLTPAAGRVSAVAKGARRSRRRFPGTLDLFNRLRVTLEKGRRPGALARLDQARLVAIWPGLRSEPARYALACLLAERLDRFAPEGGPEADTRRLYRFACEAFGTIAETALGPPLRLLLELRTVDALGLRPELERCVRCGLPLARRPVAGFHVPEGGPVCRGCAREGEQLLAVHPGTLRALAQGLRLPFAQLGRLRLGPASLAEAASLLGRFDRYHLGVELRSRRFLDEILPVSSPLPA